MHVLFVKLTSMGDLIHALPALTDAKRAIPDITFDWVIDKNFAEVAIWHPAVRKVIPTAHRQWRQHLLQSLKNGEIPKFFRTLREEKYDLVIDGQTSSKSAAIMLLTRGKRCGPDKNSAREWIASYAYQQKIAVPPSQEIHAIKRLRILFAKVLQYPFVDNQPDYGIADNQFAKLNFDLPKSYVVFVHNASWESKMWPENYWRELITIAAKDDLHVLLPWGNKAEQQRAERIAAGLSNAKVLPFCSLSEHATILKNAVGAVCSDTGLSHLAAALNVPAITLYGSTSEKLIGTTGLNQQHFIPDFPCLKCYKKTCNYQEQYHSEPACLSLAKPQEVWQRFLAIKNGIFL